MDEKIKITKKEIEYYEDSLEWCDAPHELIYKSKIKELKKQLKQLEKEKKEIKITAIKCYYQYIEVLNPNFFDHKQYINLKLKSKKINDLCFMLEHWKEFGLTEEERNNLEQNIIITKLIN